VQVLTALHRMVNNTWDVLGKAITMALLAKFSATVGMVEPLGRAVILGWEGRWFLASSAVVALYLLFPSSIRASTLVSSDRSSHALHEILG
jgi:hypothetical protein